MQDSQVSGQFWLDAATCSQYGQYWSNIAATGTDANAQAYADYYYEAAKAGGMMYDAGTATTPSQPLYQVDSQPIKKKKGEVDLDALSKKKEGKKKIVRAAGGQVWEDASLQEWDPDDFRIFCGDLGNEVNDKELTLAFNKYESFQKAKVVRDKKTGKSKGYGFVSFKDPDDYIRAMKEMQGQYVGNRPIKLRKSNWKERSVAVKDLRKSAAGKVLKD